MFGATTTSSQPTQLSNEPAKLNVEVHPPPSKPNRKGLNLFWFRFMSFYF
jgi:hypothetical protein